MGDGIMECNATQQAQSSSSRAKALCHGQLDILASDKGRMSACWQCMMGNLLCWSVADLVVKDAMWEKSIKALPLLKTNRGLRFWNWEQDKIIDSAILLLVQGMVAWWVY